MHDFSEAKTVLTVQRQRYKVSRSAQPQKVDCVYLAASAQQLIVDGNGRDPLALPAFRGCSHRHQSNEVCGPLIGVEGQTRCVDAVEVALLVCALLCGPCTQPMQG